MKCRVLKGELHYGVEGSKPRVYKTGELVDLPADVIAKLPPGIVEKDTKPVEKAGANP